MIIKQSRNIVLKKKLQHGKTDRTIQYKKDGLYTSETRQNTAMEMSLEFCLTSGVIKCVE